MPDEVMFSGVSSMSFFLTSPAFENGQAIPTLYTGEGHNHSPQLQWTEPPAKTASFALICEDPDAPRGTFIHWIVFNLPAETRTLNENYHSHDHSSDGVKQGKTSFGKVGYGGPMPPPGRAHRYYFKLFALDCVLELPSGASSEQLYSAMNGHVLAQADLMGTYSRR
jgi:Raf kinase inhibitor-like YbhB/YbcL family protein